jgi:hypothetical protein
VSEALCVLCGELLLAFKHLITFPLRAGSFQGDGYKFT